MRQAWRLRLASGLPDCCTSDPENYKVVAEIPSARLVHMQMAPGNEDQPHEHPSHSMYFLSSAKLEITNIGADGKHGAPEVMEIPAGFVPISPAGAHVVKNIGDTTASVLFVEAYPNCKPCGAIADYISPFKVAPECYQLLAEDNDWYTGEINLKKGQEGAFHHHRDHLMYVVDGGEITIYQGGDKSKEPMKLDLPPGAAIPAPMEAPPFASHIVANNGDTDLRMIFFEMKQ